jgi:hypothetical protein
MKNKLMPLFDNILLRKRALIETVNDQLKNISQIEHTRHRSIWNFIVTILCDAQGPWNPDQTTQYRLNFSVLFGVMRGKLHQVLLGNCCPDSFQKLFERAAVRAKVKIRPGRLYSRDKVGKPKRHHVFRRVC